MPNYEFIDQFFFFFALIAEKQDKKDAWTQKQDILRPVKQDAKWRDRVPKKQDSPVENRTSGNPNDKHSTGLG